MLCFSKENTVKTPFLTNLRGLAAEVQALFLVHPVHPLVVVFPSFSSAECKCAGYRNEYG